MKKLTLSVAALSIAISGFCNPPTDKTSLIQEMSMTTEDIIQSIRIINNNDSTITKQISEIYVHNLLDVLSKLEDLQMLNCENCDEID
jgi:hypothetical protein|tara:strand:+ start:108 stop:371 length:264 start_codon:yes stop_codon:yes gene_type:complete